MSAALATELEALADALRRVTVRIHGGAGRFDAVGAGVLWPSDGQPLVLTNAHVLRGSRGAPRIESARGEVVASRVVARDREIDLALLELLGSPNDFTRPATLGRARDLRVGRSEERRVGKECRSRWWPDHEKKKYPRAT